MKGFWAMLTGRGEKEYREQHQRFRDAIPNDFPADWTIKERADHHPAYSGPLANTTDAANYRRAHFGGKGPQSRREHQEFAEMQELLAQYESEAGITPGAVWADDLDFRRWLRGDNVPVEVRKRKWSVFGG